MTWRGVMRLLVGLVLGLVFFTVLATMIFLIGTGLFWHFQHPFWQWWLYLFEASGDPTVRAWLVISGVPAFAIPFLAGVVQLVRGRRVTGWSLRRDHAPTKPVDAPIRAPTDMCGRPAGFKVASQRSMGAVRLRSCVRLLRAVYDREPRWVPRMAFQNNQPALRCLCRALDVCHSSARPIAIFSYRS